MATSKDSIDEAYSDVLKSLFQQFFGAYVNAGTDEALKQQAEQRFSGGVALAAVVHDRAVALLPANV